MRLADRLDNLGTETAFAVSAAAAAWGAKGNDIYPFHLGDIDLATPAHITEAMNRAIADGKFPLSPSTIADRLIALKLEWKSNEQA